MKEKRFYQILILILVILNLSVLGFVMLKKPGPVPQNQWGGRMNAMRIMDQRLGLDTFQTEQLKVLRSEHFREMQRIQTSIVRKKMLLYDYIQTEDIQSEEAEKLLQEIGIQHQELERLNFEHFHQIREMLRPAQAQTYDSMMTKIFNRKMHRPKRKGPGGRP